MRGLREERAALHSALQRKRHYDEVRHAELDELRALLLRQRGELPAEPLAGGFGAPAEVASAWPTPPPPRTRTIEQIARIEAQMARQWQEAGVPAAPAVDAPQAARSGAQLSIDVAQPEVRAATAVEAWLGHPALTEAAVAFANGRLEAARQALAALQEQTEDAALACVAGRLLLDLLWAQGDMAGFENGAEQWAERWGQAPPVWPVQGEPATDAMPPPLVRHPWSCPHDLTAAALQGWAQQPPDALDWRGLQTLHDEAAAAGLLQALEQWADEPRVLCMAGAQRLQRLLKAATPSGRADVPLLWWRLRLALLRLLDRRAAYELAALDALASVGLPPSPWRAPRARVVEVESLPPAVEEDLPAEQADEQEFPALATAVADWAASQPPADTVGVAIEGVVAGDAGPVLARLDAALLRREGAAETAPLLVIDAQGLQRLDFAAAGALLQWLLAARARGVRVQWHGVAPLIGLLLHAVGIDEVAQVRLRQ